MGFTMSLGPWSIVLFSRLDAPALLDHSLRRSLVERVRARPGATLSEVADALSVDFTTARHHARVLDRAGHVVLVEEGRSRRLYPPGAPRRAPGPAPRVLRALFALRGGASSPASLARALAIPRGTAGSLLQALLRAGLARREGDAWRATPEAEAHLAEPTART